MRKRGTNGITLEQADRECGIHGRIMWALLALEPPVSPEEVYAAAQLPDRMDTRGAFDAAVKRLVTGDEAVWQDGKLIARVDISHGFRVACCSPGCSEKASPEDTADRAKARALLQGFTVYRDTAYCNKHGETPGVRMSRHEMRRIDRALQRF